MAQQAASQATANATATTNVSSATLYPPLENPPAPLDTADKYTEIVRLERSLVSRLNETVRQNKPLVHVINSSMLPSELVSTTKVAHKRKIDPLNRIKNLPSEEVEDEEEQEDEEKEQEDEERLEDEEEDAGGDYLVSHFDNGEGYEDNDDDGDDMTSVI